MSLYKESYDDLRKRLVKELKDVKSIKDPQVRGIMRDFETLMELLLFSLIGDNDNFFAFVIVQMVRRIDLSLPAPAAVCFKNTHFELILNPLMMLEFNIKEMKAVLIHECYHIFNQHLVRSKKYEGVVKHTIVNIGLDAAINQFIPNLPEGGITLESLRKDWGVKQHIEAEKEAEYYIKLLMDEYNNNEDFKNKVDQQEQGMGGQGDSSGNSGDNSSEQGEGSGLAKETNYGDMHNSWKESDTVGDNDANFENVVKDMANEAMANKKGNVPGHIENIIKKLNEPPIISWQNVLKHYVGIVPVPYKHTITRRDRRQPHRFDLRGKINDVQVDVVVAIDTSGSMSDKEIEYCINEVFDIVKHTKSKVTIIECDSQIQRVYEAKKPSDVKPDVRGRGGTAFAPVVDWINDNNKRSSLLVVFTDGGGEYEIQKPKCYKTLWVITRGNESMLSVREPYGEVKCLDLDEKWKKAKNK